MKILKNFFIFVISTAVNLTLFIGYYEIRYGEGSYGLRRLLDSNNSFFKNIQLIFLDYTELVLAAVGIAIVFGVILAFAEWWESLNFLPVKDFEKIDRFISLKKTTRNVKVQIEENCRMWWCGLSIEEKKEIVAEITAISQHALKKSFSVEERDELITKISKDGVIAKDAFVKSLKVIFTSGGLAEMRRQEELRRAEVAAERKRKIECATDALKEPVASALKSVGVSEENVSEILDGKAKKLAETVDEGAAKVEEFVGEEMMDLASRLFGKK